MFCPAECQPIDLERAMNFRDANFIVEEKMDGIRAVVTFIGKAPIVTGRRWYRPGVLAQIEGCDSIVNATIHDMLGGCILDGELMKDGTYHVFDLLAHDWRDIRSTRLADRKKWLGSLSEFMPENFRVVRSFSSVESLGGFEEGIVWKDTSAKYGYGWYKAKRVVTVDVSVSRILEQGVAEVEGRGKVVGVPETVKAGDIIEVEAFKVFDSGKLRNGRFVRTRDDK